MKTLLKKVYQVIPFKKQLFSCMKLAWSPPERIYRHLHFKDIFRVRTGSDKSFLIRHYGYQAENEIFWEGLEGGWEKVSVSLWKKLCGSAKVIIDVGANTGIFSLIAFTENPNASVYAFEPVKRVFRKLEDNIALNGFSIVAVCKALSNSDGKATIFDDGSEHVYSVTVNKNLRSTTTPVTPVEIDITRLDTFIRQNNINRIDLLKIDVETHEPEVLEGMGEYLDRFRPVMLVEVLNDEAGQKVEKLVSGKGYLFYNIDESKGPRLVNKITASSSFNYLFCDQKTAVALNLPVNL